MKININAIYTVVLAFVFSIIGTLASRNNWIFSAISTPYIFTLITLLLCRSTKKWFVVPYNKEFLILSGLCIVSAVVNGDDAVWSCVLMVIVFSYMMKKSIDDVVNLLIGTALGQVFFLFWYGMVDDWNGHSVCTAFAFAVFLSVFAAKKNCTYITLLLLSFFFEVILVIMASRTAIIAFFVASVYILLGTGSIVKRAIRLTLLLIVTIVIIAYYRDALLSLFFSKWESQGIGDATVLSGREEIWLQELRFDWTWFGHGSEYFMRTYNHADAHNIFIQMLGRYGAVAAIFFLLFMIIICYKAFKLRKSNIGKIVIPVLFMYLISGVFENVLFIDCKMYIPSVMFLLVLSLALRKKDVQPEQPVLIGDV